MHQLWERQACDSGPGVAAQPHLSCPVIATYAHPFYPSTVYGTGPHGMHLQLWGRGRPVTPALELRPGPLLPLAPTFLGAGT